jgi:hypothetical protein
LPAMSLRRRMPNFMQKSHGPLQVVGLGTNRISTVRIILEKAVSREAAKNAKENQGLERVCRSPNGWAVIASAMIVLKPAWRGIEGPRRAEMGHMMGETRWEER